MNTNKLVIIPAKCDPQNSFSVIERGRKNRFGEPWCHLAAVTRRETEIYVKNLSSEGSLPPPNGD